MEVTCHPRLGGAPQGRGSRNTTGTIIRKQEYTMEKILDRFLRYVAVDTQSDPESDSQPSAAKELNLLKMLRDGYIIVVICIANVSRVNAEF